MRKGYSNSVLTSQSDAEKGEQQDKLDNMAVMHDKAKHSIISERDGWEYYEGMEALCKALSGLRNFS